MECREPGIIRDEELIAYLEGEHVRPEVSTHIARCQACSSRLATYRNLDCTLTQKLYRWDCPSSQQLGEYHLELLNKQQVMAVQNHVQGCVLCAAELETLGMFLAADPLLEAPVAVSPPIAVGAGGVQQDVRQAVGQIKEQAQTSIRQVMALFLPPPSSHLAYQRSSVPKETVTIWPRDYQADDIRISLQLEPESGARQRGMLQLIGFVTQQGQAISALQGLAVQLSAGTEYAETQHIDELGNVVFSALSPARYRLELVLPDGLVVVEDIPVQALS